jgi:hypothetical protein
MAVGKSKTVWKNIHWWFCFCPQPSLPTHIRFFFNRFRSAFVMPYAPRWSFVFCSLRGYGLPTHKQKVLARAYGRLYILRGESGGGHAPFSCAPFSSQAPPATPVRLLGRALTHE